MLVGDSYSQTPLTGYHWDLIVSFHLGGVSICPCFILYIVSKRDQTNDIHLRLGVRGLQQYPLREV